MEQEISQWVTTLWQGAASTIAWEIAIYGALAAVLTGLAVLVFKLVASVLLGDPSGRWSGAWTAVWVTTLAVTVLAAAVIGGGAGLIRGAEKALRQSDFGARTLPTIAQQSVFMYAIVYYADPATLQQGNLGDLANLSTLNEVQSFARGKAPLDAARLQTRLQEFDDGHKLADLLRGAREDLARLTPVLGDDLPGVKAAADMVVQYAAAPQLEEAAAVGLPAPILNLEGAAGLHGDPSTITRDELAEHVRENVAIPALITPVKVLVRPWQIAAGIVAALMFLLLLATRIVVWRTADSSPDPVQTARE